MFLCIDKTSFCLLSLFKAGREEDVEIRRETAAALNSLSLNEENKLDSASVFSNFEDSIREVVLRVVS